MPHPLIHRELTHRERSRYTYILRAAIGAIAYIYLGLYFLSGANTPPERIGSALLAIGATFQFAAASILPLLLSAGLIARERQENTLGILLLADVSGFGVYGAKFLSAFLPAALLILGALPVLAFGAIFGAVQVDGLVVQTLLYLAAAFAITATGMLGSTLSKHPGPAFFLAALGVLFWSLSMDILERLAAGATLNLWRSSFNPLAVAWWHSQGSAPDPRWINSGAITILIGTVLIVYGRRMLPRVVQERPRARGRWIPFIHRAPRPLRNRPWSPHPAQILLARRMGGWSSAIRPAPLRIIAALALIPINLLVCIGPITVLILMAYDVVSSIRNARNTGALDDVRLASTTEADFAKWIYGGQVRRCMFYMPAMIFAGGLGYSGITLMTIFDGANPDFGAIPLFLFILAAGVAFPLAQIRLIVALACLNEKRFAKDIRKPVSASVWSFIGYLFLFGAMFGFLILLLGRIGKMIETLPSIEFIALIAFYALVTFALHGASLLTVDQYKTLEE